MTWGRGLCKTSYDFQKAGDFDNRRSKVLNSSFIFSFFYSDEDFLKTNFRSTGRFMDVRQQDNLLTAVSSRRAGFFST